jgi:hypothetical protein
MLDDPRRPPLPHVVDHFDAIRCRIQIPLAVDQRTIKFENDSFLILSLNGGALSAVAMSASPADQRRTLNSGPPLVRH